MEVHAPWSFGLAERRIIAETSFSPQKHKDLKNPHREKTDGSLCVSFASLWCFSIYYLYVFIQ